MYRRVNIYIYTSIYTCIHIYLCNNEGTNKTFVYVHNCIFVLMKICAVKCIRNNRDINITNALQVTMSLIRHTSMCIQLKYACCIHVYVHTYGEEHSK